MDKEDRQQIIKELEVLRTELLAYKDSQEEAGSEEGNASLEVITDLRRAYTAEMNVDCWDSKEIDSIRQEIYEQYGQESGVDYADSQQKSLTRRR